MNRLIAAVPSLTQQSVRLIGSTPALRVDRVDITKLKEKQKHFQIEDGTPVYLKGGIPDKILFLTTAGLCVVGLAYMGNLFYNMAKPPQN